MTLQFSREEFAQRFEELHPPFAPQAAVVEATRCLYCFDAPCTAACPTHIDVPGFIKKIASGNLRGSAADDSRFEHSGLELFPRLPRGCFVRRRLRDARYDHRQPIEIGRLQRHAMDWFYAHSPSRTGRSRIAENASPASARARHRSPARPNFAAADSRSPFSISNPLAGGLNTYGSPNISFGPPTVCKKSS